jgi:hypothetical protein
MQDVSPEFLDEGLQMTLGKTWILMLTVVLSLPAWAARQAVTDDGMRVLLKDDGTWEVLENTAGQDQEDRQARLELLRLDGLTNGCRLGLRLTNGLKEPIRSLVLRFTAYKPGRVAYTSVTRGYFNIKSTDSQYQTVLFAGVTCEEITEVEVTAADKCRVGTDAGYWYGSDRCIGGVDVVPSDKIRIYK